MANSRVAETRAEKEEFLKALCKTKGLTYPLQKLYIRSFKQEKEMELWGRDDAHSTYTLLETYSICASSGTLGPKRQEGDRQVPEGFYHVSSFNPNSSYHLSLAINYPNASDKILSDKTRPGGAICFLGNCVTIGCLPMTDDKIKEIYWLAVLAKNHYNGNIPVSIFPARLTDTNMAALNHSYSAQPALTAFWANLKGGYDYFEKHKKLPTVSVSADGKYSFR